MVQEGDKMKSITIHSIDDQLADLIKKKAEAKGASLNKTIKELLTSALGLNRIIKKRKDFSEFSGMWSEKEAEEFDKAVEDFEKIDKEDWR